MLYIDSNKKRVKTWEERNGLQLPVGTSVPNSNKSISNNNKNVNTQKGKVNSNNNLSGNNKLSYKTLRKLCDALDICPCELICGANHRTVLENTVDLIKHMDEEQQIIIHQMVLAFYETNVELKNKK